VLKSKSEVYNSIGSILPFTVTLSIGLHIDYVSGVNILWREPLIKIGTPNYFVAASSLEAILTLGDKYEASIL